MLIYSITHCGLLYAIEEYSSTAAPPIAAKSNTRPNPVPIEEYSSTAAPPIKQTKTEIDDNSYTTESTNNNNNNNAITWQAEKKEELPFSTVLASKLQGGVEYYLTKYISKYNANKKREAEMVGPEKSLVDLEQTSAADYQSILSVAGGATSFLPHIKIGLLTKFGRHAMTEEEWADTKKYPTLFFGVFFRRLVESLGVVLADPDKVWAKLDACILKEGSIDSAPFEFTDPHIRSVDTRMKHMHLVDASEGRALFMKVTELEKKMGADEDTLIDLCKFAKEKLLRALVSLPDSYNTLYMLAQTENWLGKKWHPQEDKSSRQMLFASAERHVRDAIKIVTRKREGAGRGDEELFALENEMKNFLSTVNKNKASALKKSSGNNAMKVMTSSMLPTTQSQREKEQGKVFSSEK
eukprot:TRINITY_DN1526_c0_g1_i1.p1 TRINITY_DN1526_c0_g1~~TRINITY_DN1526_c0_g1_i1.p1  ORF type:complete len:410 (-),score=117.25 TRINITY_DN1526_c0_g1_i1:489-1718(-)